MRKPKYIRGDKVFHVLPESPVGVVIDAIYRQSTGLWTYYVMFDPMIAALEYEEFELSDCKSFQ
jgi:hypothetical protein